MIKKKDYSYMSRFLNYMIRIIDSAPSTSVSL
jgi:hypothetical protein